MKQTFHQLNGIYNNQVYVLVKNRGPKVHKLKKKVGNIFPRGMAYVRLCQIEVSNKYRTKGR